MGRIIDAKHYVYDYDGEAESEHIENDRNTKLPLLLVTIENDLMQKGESGVEGGNKRIGERCGHTCDGHPKKRMKITERVRDNTKQISSNRGICITNSHNAVGIITGCVYSV